VAYKKKRDILPLLHTNIREEPELELIEAYIKKRIEHVMKKYVEKAFGNTTSNLTWDDSITENDLNGFYIHWDTSKNHITWASKNGFTWSNKSNIVW
jgi:hypothetical protein